MPSRSLSTWFPLRWIASWSWTERAIVGFTWLAPFAAFFVDRSDVAGMLALLAFLALNVVVYRHGGWGLLEPHFYYDVVRLARRGRSTTLRVAYIIAMFIGLAFVHEGTHGIRMNDMARVSERFAFALFMVQNIAILILTPAYLGSALTEEKERRTLELLFTTHLNNTEIVLGKLFSRTIHLFGFVLAGFPILSLMQLWGGIDMLLIAGNIANTMLNILTIGSLCLFFSALARTVAGGVMTSYAIVLPIGFCCSISLQGFPLVLQDARWGSGQNLTVQDIGALAVAHLTVTVICLGLAMIALREYEPFSPVPSDPDRLRASLGPVMELHGRTPPARVEETLDDFSIPYTLPPVTDEALLWKERYVGGPPLIASPIMLVPAIPFMVTGTMIMLVFLSHVLLSAPDHYQEAVRVWSIVLRFFYYVFLASYLLGVAYRTTSTVARERQQQTLDPLLLLPIDRRDILRSKWIGAMWRGWPWLALLAGDIGVGVLVGAYHPLSALLLCLAPIPLILFFSTLGLLISVLSSTVLRANLVMVVILVIFASGAIGNIISASPFAYIETFTFTIFDSIPDHDDLHGSATTRLLRQIVIAAGSIVCYSLCALGFWKFAILRFEDRSRPTAAE